MGDIKCVLLDIEGTICPISFVKDTLFPYALKALPDVLKSKWDDEDFTPYRDAFPDDAKASPEALQAHVEDLTKRDVKIAYLKNLQGYLWEHGYESGEYATPLFPDVVPWLKMWKEAGYQLAIYSSGSVFAQKLLFGHVRLPTAGAGPDVGAKRSHAEVADGDEEDAKPPSKKRAADTSARDTEAQTNSDIDNKTATSKDSANSEDLQYLIADWFDTTNAGLKTEANSYTKIAESLELSPDEIFFLSDNVKEVDAARNADMEAILVDRPGNAEISKADQRRLGVVQSFEEVDLIGEDIEYGSDSFDDELDEDAPSASEDDDET